MKIPVLMFIRPHYLTLILLPALFPGCASGPEEGELPFPSFYLEYGGMASYETTQPVKLPISETSFEVFTTPVFTANEMIKVELVQVDRGKALRFVLDQRARRKLERLSADNIGYRLTLFNGGEPIGARMIDGMMRNGIIYTFVEIPDDELPELVVEMNEALVQAHKAAWR